MIDAVIQKLISDADVQELVGLNEADNKVKVYPTVAAQSEKHPYVIVRLASKEPMLCKGKRATDFNATFEVHSVAKTYHKAEHIDYACELALSGAQFNYTNAFVVCKMSSVMYQNSRDGFYEASTGVLYSRVTTYSAMIHESPVTT